MKKILVMLVGLLMVSGVFALDAGTPYTLTIQWIIPSDTTFTVDLAGAESTIDFNPATKTETDVEPDSQDYGASTPIVTITNTGNTALNFTHNVSAVPAYAVLWAYSNNTDTNVAVSEGASVNQVGGDVGISEVVQIYMWTNVTDATAGTTSETYQISSLLAS